MRFVSARQITFTVNYNDLYLKAPQKYALFKFTILLRFSQLEKVKLVYIM